MADRHRLASDDENELQFVRRHETLLGLSLELSALSSFDAAVRDRLAETITNALYSATLVNMTVLADLVVLAQIFLMFSYSLF